MRNVIGIRANYARSPVFFFPFLNFFMGMILPHGSSGSSLGGSGSSLGVVSKPHVSTGFSSATAIAGSGIALVPLDSEPAADDAACVECPELTSDSSGSAKDVFLLGLTSSTASTKESQYPEANV